jgi:hypothetical protein
VAWQFADVDSDGPYANDWHSSLFGGLGAGWHWTPHWKTEIDFGASDEDTVYRTTSIVINGQTAFQPSWLRYSRRTLGVSQQYQFYENAWFHPHLAAGVNLTWEERTETFDRSVFYGPGPFYGPVPEARTEGPTTEFTLRPFVAAGAKIYVAERAFIRTDIRFAIRNGFDETLTRLGFGFDF